MLKGKRIWITLVAISLLVLGTSEWADSDSDKIECLTEQSSQIYLAKGGVQSKGGIPRSQVLLEIFMRPT